MDESSIWADVSTVISIALTIPFLCYCVEVAYLWWPSFKKSFDEGEELASSKLAKGIWIGFVSNFFDNLYWGVTWFAFYMQWPIALAFLAAGPLVNIFFRQTGGVLAALNHVEAATELHKDEQPKYRKYYWVAGIVVGIFLWVLK
tara:strand:- start:855 stop:1289 length:435 start_codon:yes stop_codon:yes gene_type:complete